MKFWGYEWGQGDQVSIEFEPVGTAEFQRFLEYFSLTYGFVVPPMIDTIDSYSADFEILGSNARISMDAWSFSIAFEKRAIRDQVLAALQALPDDYFS